MLCLLGVSLFEHRLRGFKDVKKSVSGKIRTRSFRGNLKIDLRNDKLKTN